MYASLRSREIAQSFGITRFETLVEVPILKFSSFRYLLRGLRFITGLIFPFIFGT